MSASLFSSVPESSRVPAPAFRWGTRVALPLAVLLAFGAVFAGSLAKSLTPAVAVETLPVLERPAIRAVAASSDAADSAAVTVQAAGWIEPAPFATYATALTHGTIEEVLILESDPVTKGQVLARIVGDEARLALQRAEAEARAAEEAWTANIESRREAAVASAAVRETSASLELARAELEVEQALLREAQRIFRRRENLVSGGSVSREEFDTAEASADAQAARVRVVERRIEELGAQLERVRAEDAAARRRLELRTEERRRLDLARVDLAEAHLRVQRLEIRSPIDGVVMTRLVEPGSVVMTASDNPMMARVAELYDPRRLQVRVDVPLADAAKISVGQRAQVLVEVLPDRTFSGTVSRITHLANIQKNTLEVKVALDDPAPELKPAMLARVRFLALQETAAGKPATGALSVFAPAQAVGGDAAWVLTHFDGQEGLAEHRPLTLTGAEHDGWQEIANGLNPGDLLIVSSAAPLQPGQRVRLRALEGSTHHGLH